MVVTDMSGQVDWDNRDEVFAWLRDNVLSSERVAELTGLAQKSIYVYSGRPGMHFPEPIPWISSERCKLWWRRDIEVWLESRRA
jgi:predicted DNA-binding transcriptional regulator AlpA